MSARVVSIDSAGSVETTYQIPVDALYWKITSWLSRTRGYDVDPLATLITSLPCVRIVAEFGVPAEMTSFQPTIVWSAGAFGSLLEANAPLVVFSSASSPGLAV